MRIVIYGQARTGSTALFLQLQAALPTQTRCLFEPHPSEIPPTGDVLVKSLVMSLPDDLTRPPVDASIFDRRVVLVRDPRDRLISVLLFLLHWHSPAYPPLWQYAPRGFEALLRLLRQKERVPTSVTVVQLFEDVLRLRFGFDQWDARRTWFHLQAKFLIFEATLPRHTLLCYETLSAHTPVATPRAYASIRRHATTGEWRQWFTDTDCAAFRPLLLPYLHRYEYADDWTLPTQQTIDPVYSSHYVEKWLRIQRRQHHAASRA